MQHLSTNAAKKAAFSDMKHSNVRIMYLYNEKKLRQLLTVDEYEYVPLDKLEKLSL